MNIWVVKNNMYQSYSSCGSLESDLSQLIDILNSVEVDNAYIVSEYISVIDYTLSTVKRDLEIMLQVNEVELHIFFSEFNSKTSEMIYELDALSSELNSLSLMADELYMQYTLYKLDESLEEGYEFFPPEYYLSADCLRDFIPIIVSVKNELEIFKMMIDTNNNKLRVGVRR